MKLNAWDRFTGWFAPSWTLDRVRHRAALATVGRHYEAAKGGRRTQGWARTRGDANAVTATAITELRMHARDLIRNDGHALRGQEIIANHTVGWGIVPKPVASDAVRAKASDLWKRWADSTECDADGQLSFGGIQHLVVQSLVESGEILIRRRPRLLSDKLTIPLQLQVLEADFIDTSKEAQTSMAGGPIVLGVEFDKLGRRAAYWLFPEHPGARTASGESRRVPATEILHIYRKKCPGQVRGVSWLGAAIVKLKDLDEYDDAELLKQKIAACFAAFVTDLDGSTPAVGEEDPTNSLVETIEPGMVSHLPPGKQVTFGNPPTTTSDSFATRNLRKIAATMGVTYEDLTGDYSQVNFSSARMGRLAHWGYVRNWQWNLLVPQLCNGVWSWAMESAAAAGLLPEGIGAEWTAPPMPMIEPDKEGLAYQRLVRNGVMTHAEMIREQGGDPDAHWEEYAAGLQKLDGLKIKLDSDVRAVSQAGLTQERASAGGGEGPPPKSE